MQHAHRARRQNQGESVAQLAPSGCPGAQALRAALELSGADGKEDVLRPFLTGAPSWRAQAVRARSLVEETRCACMAATGLTPASYATITCASRRSGQGSSGFTLPPAAPHAMARLAP